MRRKIPVTPRDQSASHSLSHRPNDRSDGQSRSTMKVANHFRPETDKLRPLDSCIFLRQEIDHIKVIHLNDRTVKKGKGKKKKKMEIKEV